MELAAQLASRNLTHTNEVLPLVVSRETFYSKYVKRLLDILISGAALVVFGPINLFLAIATRLDVGSPILYKQQRIGKDQELFTLVKFRNMTNDRDENGELLPPSERVTKFGKFVRKYSLDELLNFVSVFCGDMSIIGPRPMPKEHLSRLCDRHLQRHSVSPGLLCPISKEMMERYPSPEPYSRYQTQFENDVWYVENVTFANDVKLLIELFKATFDMDRRAKNAGSASPFLGYDENGLAVSRKHYEDHHFGEA